jgi:hypothetical protein
MLQPAVVPAALTEAAFQAGAGCHFPVAEFHHGPLGPLRWIVASTVGEECCAAAVPDTVRSACVEVPELGLGTVAPAAGLVIFVVG